MKNFRFRISIAFAMFIAIFFTAAIIEVCIITLMKYETNSTAKNSAEMLFNEISEKTKAEINVVLESLSTLTEVASYSIENNQKNSLSNDFDSNIPLMRSILDSRSDVMSIYVGFGNGRFHQLIATRGNESIQKSYNTPKDTIYINRKIIPDKNGKLIEHWEFLDKNLNIIQKWLNSNFQYNPSQRPWFTQAKTNSETIFTNPYIFSSSKLPGLTCARMLSDIDAVIGIDITLTQLSQMLAGDKSAENNSVWIMNDNYQLVAHKDISWNKVFSDDFELPMAEEFSDPIVKSVISKMKLISLDSKNKPFFVDINDRLHIARIVPMPITSEVNLNIAVATSVGEITENINKMGFRIVIVTIAVFCILLPFAILLSRRVAKSFQQLSMEAKKIQQFDFSSSNPIKSLLNEVHNVANTYDSMKSTLQNKTDNLIYTQENLEMLIQEGLAISNEKELDKLVSLTFQAAQKLTKADGGVMYLKEDQKLAVELLSLGSESIVLGGLSKKPAPRVKVMPSITAFLAPNSVLQPVCEAFNSRKIISTEDREFELFPTGLPEEPREFEINSQISVPIITQRDEILGVIQLFNPGSNSKEKISAITDEIKDYVGFLASQVAVTLDNRNLINSLRELFDSLVQVVASSIDSKSPYTAGHCARVPVIAEMLAEATDKTVDGPLQNFQLDKHDGKRQLWLAAWLHDCGKVSTPEFVIDKATKLETVYNRIHEIRMRFEVLYRDKIIEVYKKKYTQNLSQDLEQELENELELELKKLREEFEFVANANVGGEYMSDDAKEKLQDIAKREWLRYFSDTIGVSKKELHSKEETEESLPVVEKLLSDKAEHIVPRKNDYSDIVDVDGEAIKVPENEYNKGEIYNLSIGRGTLTEEERFKISEHTLNGLKMLEKIPFPDNLSNVVQIATEHHETLNGTGYPFKKKKDQLSVETRILAIADIFEALTASDRPYKKRKTLSEALKIMTFMRKDQHIDSDIFDIFLQNGIYKKYATQYLHPDQIDVDDISQYLSE